MNQETLEPPNTRFRECFNLILVSLHDSTPSSPIHRTFRRSRAPLSLKGNLVRRSWDAIERHVDDRRIPTGRRGLRCRLKSFPVGATRFVDVNMRVHQTGQYRGIPEVLALEISRYFTRRNDSPNFFSFHQDRSRTDTFRRYHPLRDNGPRPQN
jgi:hypothetical protein